MGLVSNERQEEDHARLWDYTKLQLKWPNLGWINPRFFAVWYLSFMWMLLEKPEHVQSLSFSENNIQVVSTLWVYGVLNLVGHTSRVSHSSQRVTPICSACSHNSNRGKLRMHSFTLTIERTVWVCVCACISRGGHSHIYSIATTVNVSFGTFVIPCLDVCIKGSDWH